MARSRQKHQTKKIMFDGKEYEPEIVQSTVQIGKLDGEGPWFDQTRAENLQVYVAYERGGALIPVSEYGTPVATFMICPDYAMITKMVDMESDSYLTLVQMFVKIAQEDKAVFDPMKIVHAVDKGTVSDMLAGRRLGTTQFKDGDLVINTDFKATNLQ